ncbi:upstream activation factor subunit spp27-like protein [Tanacetum coccineum]
MASTRVFNATKTLFAAAKSTTTTAAAKKKKPTVKKPTEKTVKAAVGILKASPISPALAQFLGVNESARTDAVKKIWEHIKLNQLQDHSIRMKICNGFTTSKRGLGYNRALAVTVVVDNLRINNHRSSSELFKLDGDHSWVVRNGKTYSISLVCMQISECLFLATRQYCSVWCSDGGSFSDDGMPSQFSLNDHLTPHIPIYTPVG